jgi:hypothetical protein
MFRNLSLILILSVVGVSSACTTANAPSNTDANANKTVVIPANSANMPPEFAGNVTPPANSTAATPGIPDPKTMNANIPKGTAPTPGIPSAEELKKPQPKNTPPIPGIPSAEELKKQMNRKVDPSEVNNPKGLVPKTDASNTAANAVNTGVRTVTKPKPPQ